jgi:hypothetical protein
MGAAVKATSPAMENHFLIMIFCNEKMSSRPSFPRPLSQPLFRKSKARAARLFPARNLSCRNKNCPGTTKSGTAGDGAGWWSKRETEKHTLRHARGFSVGERETDVSRGDLAAIAHAIRVTASAAVFVLVRHLRLAAKITAEMAIAIPHVLALAITASMFTSHGDLLGKTVESSLSPLFFQTSPVPRAQ